MSTEGLTGVPGCVYWASKDALDQAEADVLQTHGADPESWGGPHWAGRLTPLWSSASACGLWAMAVCHKSRYHQALWFIVVFYFPESEANAKLSVPRQKRRGKRFEVHFHTTEQTCVCNHLRYESSGRSHTQARRFNDNINKPLQTWNSDLLLLHSHSQSVTHTFEHIFARKIWDFPCKFLEIPHWRCFPLTLFNPLLAKWIE